MPVPVQALYGLAVSTAYGILLGGLFALMGLGLSLLLGILRIVDLAHGDFIVLAGYLSYAAMSYAGLGNPFFTLIVVVPVMFALGFSLQRLLNRVITKLHVVALMLLSIAFIIQNALLLVFTADYRNLAPDMSSTSVNLLFVRVPLAYLLDFAAATIVFITLYMLLKYTLIGKAIRAVPEDSLAALMVGIDPLLVYSYATGIALATAGTAGVMAGMTFEFVPSTGPDYLVIGLGVVILGGLGSLKGTYLGGILMGLAFTLSGFFFGSHYQAMIWYLIMFIFLVIRPKGLFGE